MGRYPLLALALALLLLDANADSDPSPPDFDLKNGERLLLVHQVEPVEVQEVFPVLPEKAHEAPKKRVTVKKRPRTKPRPRIHVEKKFSNEVERAGKQYNRRRLQPVASASVARAVSSAQDLASGRTTEKCAS